jgi:hypothetical protein
MADQPFRETRPQKFSNCLVGDETDIVMNKNENLDGDHWQCQKYDSDAC